MATAELAERVALVTGGAQGIGACIAEYFAENGIRIAIVDLQGDRARALAARLTEQYGVRCLGVEADIASEAGCLLAVRETTEALGRLDILINNAAPRRDRGTVGALVAPDWKPTEEVMLQGTIRLVDAALSHLTASGCGSIINVSSVVASAVGYHHCSWAYHVAKAGLEQLTRWMAVKFGAAHIRVNAVAPGLVDREEGRRASDDPVNRRVIQSTIPLGRAGRGRDIAGAALFLCSDKAEYITGQILTVDGGLGLHEVWSAAVMNAGTDLQPL